MSTTTDTPATPPRVLTSMYEGIPCHMVLDEVLLWLRERNSTADILEALARIERGVKR